MYVQAATESADSCCRQDSWRLSADDSHAQKGDSQAFGSEPPLSRRTSVSVGLIVGQQRESKIFASYDL